MTFHWCHSMTSCCRCLKHLMVLQSISTSCHHTAEGCMKLDQCFLQLPSSAWLWCWSLSWSKSIKTNAVGSGHVFARLQSWPYLKFQVYSTSLDLLAVKHKHHVYCVHTVHYFSFYHWIVCINSAFYICTYLSLRLFELLHVTLSVSKCLHFILGMNAWMRSLHIIYIIYSSHSKFISKVNK